MAESKGSGKKSRFLSPNVQFALIVVLGIAFTFVIVGLLFLQSIGDSRDLEQFFLGELDSSPDSSDSYELILRASGIESADKTIEASIVFYDRELNTVVLEETVSLLSDDQGLIRSQSIDFSDVDRLHVFDILVKGEKHQQIKFSNVTFGPNLSLDLSYRDLPPGDLPWSEIGQDKVVDLGDYQALISRMGSKEVNDLLVADLDYNGIINAQDRSLLLKTLVGGTQ
jgi:hypothetical protein